jgi:outer membrane protein OmpA-like peptidoglycan-associated protein
MRTLILILLFGLISNICYTQVNANITEKRNVYNNKGDYYFDRNEFKKAIVYYNMAYQKDASDYFSILKKAEAYAKLKFYPQAEECYRIVFESKRPLDNVYRLRYALVLLANNKPEEFKQWLGMYSQIVERETKGENYLVSKEKRIQLYKDSSIVLVSNTQDLDTIHFKIKYEGYKYQRRSSVEDNQIYLVLSNGEEYSITASGTDDFNFSFQPMENYKLIVQRENIMAEDILTNEELTPEQRKTNFLKPPPIQKDELKLQWGMKYQFSSGKYRIPPQYINTLKEIAGNYQSPAANTVDLTALVKELQLADGEIYTIKFVRADDPDDSHKKFEISTVTMNDKTINIYGQSFLVVLPDRIEENFAIQTNIEELQKNFSPKKYALIVDEGPIFKEEEESAPKYLISLTVNTDSIEKVKPVNRLSAKEISIIPGTEYILTLSKPDPNTGEDIEIIVPLTRGVKYNLSSSEESNAEYKKALAEFLIGREGLELANEEVIDISVLSKEIEVQPGEDLSFNLLPAKQFGKKPAVSEEIKLSLTLDGKVFEITRNEKYAINVPFNHNRKVNFQTDLDYMQENFKADAFTLRLDTISFTSEIIVDTTGYGERKTSGWLCMSVNTDSIEEVERQDQFTAKEVSIIPGKDYILTVSKVDAKTGKEDEIIVPLLRQVKYNFTSNPGSEEAYKGSLKEFLAGRENIENTDGTVIDITLLSKELQIQEGDKISFSLLPVKKLSRKPTTEDTAKSSLFLDNKVVEFTHIQKYTINMPLNNERQVNMQTNIEYLQENFEPGSFTLNVDTISFFPEITVDTTGYGYRAINEKKQIKDPVFDVITINFDLNEYSLLPEAKKTIQENVIDELKGDSRLYVTIKGYTDALGDADYNLNLSKKRAESVKEFLKSNEIGENRIKTFSYGASQSLKEGINWEDLDETELKKYRKVEIVIYLPK